MAAEVDAWDLSDEELEAAFREAKAEANSPETEIEEEVYEDVATDDVENEDEVEEFDESTEDEEEVEDLEQPEEDSDDDTSDDDEEEEDSEEDSEDEEADPDQEAEAEDEQTDEDEDESEEEEQPTQNSLEEFFKQTTKVRANGVDHEFTNKEKLEMFDKMFPQATDYTKKMQAIKPYRKMIDALEQEGLKNDDVNFMIDVLKGDKEAVAELIKRTGVDALDLDTENTNYVAKDYGRDETELTIRDIVDEISVDKEYAVTHNVLDKQWDDSSREEFVKDPELIKLLHTDVKTGMFDKVNPIAQKMKVYDGGKRSDLDYYKAAAGEYFKQQAEQEQRQTAEAARQAESEAKEQEAQKVKEVKAKQEKRKVVKQESNKRKAATTPKKASTGNKGVVDYLDESEEAFDEWYKTKIENAY